MKEFEEYLRDSLKEYNKLIDESDEYGAGREYQYYEGKADAIEEIMCWLGM